MKLNADIIFNNIKEITKAEISGPRTENLFLQRPEFYLDEKRDFLENHCYVASADHLPNRPVIENNVVLILLGNSAKTNFFRHRCCIINISGEMGIFELFNTIQSIFDKY